MGATECRLLGACADRRMLVTRNAQLVVAYTPTTRRCTCRRLTNHALVAWLVIFTYSETAYTQLASCHDRPPSGNSVNSTVGVNWAVVLLSTVSVRRRPVFLLLVSRSTASHTHVSTARGCIGFDDRGTNEVYNRWAGGAGQELSSKRQVGQNGTGMRPSEIYIERLDSGSSYF